MMAIYDFKDFLALDDVADYLRDRGVCDLNLLDYQDQCKLTDLISNLATENKITPVFSYYGFAFDLSDPQNKDILTNKAEYKLFLAYSSPMLDDWHNSRAIKLSGFDERARPNEPFFDFDKPQTKNFYHYQAFGSGKSYVLELSNYKQYPSLLTPKCELERLFSTSPNPSKPTAQPQAKDDEITALKARIAELEQVQTTDTPQASLPPYNTALLALFDVYKTHWQDHNRPPKQDFIIRWITDNYPTLKGSKATYIDKILRHQDP